MVDAPIVQGECDNCIDDAARSITEGSIMHEVSGGATKLCHNCYGHFEDRIEVGDVDDEILERHQDELQ